MEKIFRAGIVGTGMMGVLQAEALRRIPGVQIAAVTSRNLETAKSFCRERFIPHAYDNLEEMLEKNSWMFFMYVLPTILTLRSAKKHCSPVSTFTAKNHLQTRQRKQSSL